MMQDNQTRALLEIAKSLVLIATELANLREALPTEGMWNRLCEAVRSDHPLQGETLYGIAEGLHEIASAMEGRIDVNLIDRGDAPGA